jgi:hypothetical protein
MKNATRLLKRQALAYEAVIITLGRFYARRSRIAKLQNSQMQNANPRDDQLAATIARATGAGSSIVMKQVSGNR